ncbi:MAG: Rieske 2Fe-2S domain-containing protein [Chloroflexota bacterium]
MFHLLRRIIDQQTWLDTIGGPLQTYLAKLFKSGPGAKQLQNFLNGVWLGHPLHPTLTDVPVGAWTATVALDAAAALTGDQGFERASDVSLGTGLAAAYASAVTGFTDWTDTYGFERKLGLLHGIFMVTTTVTYSAALVARLSGARKAGVALSNLGYGLLATGAYLGGDEVFEVGYPVNHTAFLQGPGEYTAVIPETELPSDKPTAVTVKNVPILLVKQGSQIYALDDTCVHAGCSLAGGTLAGRTITCPCHGSEYDLSDGSVINGPATMPEPAYHVRVQNGMIEIKLAE